MEAKKTRLARVVSGFTVADAFALVLIMAKVAVSAAIITQ